MVDSLVVACSCRSGLADMFVITSLLMLVAGIGAVCFGATRYIRKNPVDGSPYSADYQGADAGMKNGCVFTWEVVE